MRMQGKFWKSFGLLLEWLGVIYFVGFGLFGLFFGIVYPKIVNSLRVSGQQSFLGVEQNMVLPLLLFFVVISAATWYEGRELRQTEDLNLFDKAVAVAILLVLLVFASPQLLEAYSTLLPLIKG
jgi:hypothetical protein